VWARWGRADSTGTREADSAAAGVSSSSAGTDVLSDDAGGTGLSSGAAGGTRAAVATRRRGLAMRLEREVRAGVVAVRPLERGDRVAQALVGAVLGHVNHQTDVEIARPAPFGVGHPAPPESEPLPTLAPLRNLQLHPSFRRGHLDGRAQHRFADGDRHLHHEIPTFPLEVGMRADLDDEVQVAGRVAAARPALPLDPHACTVAHPGGNLDRETLAFADRPRARAARAGAHTLASRPATRGARCGPANRHRRLRPADGVQEVDLDR